MRARPSLRHWSVSWGRGLLVDGEVDGTGLVVGCGRTAVARAVALLSRSTITVNHVAAQDQARPASSETSSFSSVSSSTYWRLMRTRQHHEDGDEHEDEPGALTELRGHEDDVDHEGDDAADPVDEDALLPALLLLREVVLRHARLAHGEAGEHADRVEGDQAAHAGVGGDHEGHGTSGQEQDAVGEHQALTALHELAGHVGVAGREVGEAGEVGEARCWRRA